MKALTDRLEWVRIYLQAVQRGDASERLRQAMLEEFNGAVAIAEAIPDNLSIAAPAVPRVGDDECLVIEVDCSLSPESMGRAREAFRWSVERGDPIFIGSPFRLAAIVKRRTKGDADRSAPDRIIELAGV